MATQAKLDILITATTDFANVSKEIRDQLKGIKAQLESLSSVKNPTKGVEDGLKNVGDQAGAAQKKLGGLLGMLKVDFSNTVTKAALDLGKMYLGFQALKAGVGVFLDLTAAGVDFNSTIENSKLGIASLFTALGDVRDAQGNILKGEEALKGAAQLAEAQVKELRRAGLETAATTKELVLAFQTALGGGLSAGLTPDQIRKLTIQFSQAAGALNVPQIQLSQEIGSALRGDITQDSRIAKALQLTSAEVQKWKAEGPDKLFEELASRMEAFSVAGKEIAKTWEAVVSNLTEAKDSISGYITEGYFDKIKTAANQALGGIFDLKELKVDSSISGVVDLLRDAYDQIGDFFARAISGGVALIKEFSAWVDRNRSELGGIGTEFTRILGFLGNILGVASTFLSTIVSWGVESGVFRNALSIIADSLDAIKNLLQLIAGLFSGEVGDAVKLFGDGISFVAGLISHIVSDVKKLTEGFKYIAELDFTNLKRLLLEEGQPTEELQRLKSLGTAPTPEKTALRADNAFQELTKRGVSPIAAAGIVGNLAQESNFTPFAVGDKGSAFGIAQWRLERRDALTRFAAERKAKIDDLGVQFDFLIKEARERGDLAALNKANTPEEASKIFADLFERPNPDPEKANYAYRAQVAREVLSRSQGVTLDPKANAQVNSEKERLQKEAEALYDARRRTEEGAIQRRSELEQNANRQELEQLRRTLDAKLALEQDYSKRSQLESEFAIQAKAVQAKDLDAQEGALLEQRALLEKKIGRIQSGADGSERTATARETEATGLRESLATIYQQLDLLKSKRVDLERSTEADVLRITNESVLKRKEAEDRLYEVNLDSRRSALERESQLAHAAIQDEQQDLEASLAAKQISQAQYYALVGNLRLKDLQIEEQKTQREKQLLEEQLQRTSAANLDPTTKEERLVKLRDQLAAITVTLIGYERQRADIVASNQAQFAALEQSEIDRAQQLLDKYDQIGSVNRQFRVDAAELANNSQIDPTTKANLWKEWSRQYQSAMGSAQQSTKDTGNAFQSFVDQAEQSLGSINVLAFNAFQGMQGAVQQFFQSSIQGTSNLKQAFTNLIANLTSQILAFMTMKAVLSFIKILGGGLGGFDFSGIAADSAEIGGGVAGEVFKGAGLYAEGGYISGPGTGTSDSIPAWLSNGEFVMPAHVTSQVLPALELLRRGDYSVLNRLHGSVSVHTPRRPYFSGGGLVDTRTSPEAGKNEVHITVNIAGDKTDSSVKTKEGSVKFAQEIQNAVDAAILKQKRAGGHLYSR